MKKLLRFLHEVGSIGVLGALAAHLVLLVTARGMSLVQYAAVRQGIHAISVWILLPSLALVLMTGFFAMALHAPFQNARWAWVKAATGVLMLEGTLGSVQGTARRAAELSQAAAASGVIDEAAMADVLRHEWGGLWTITFFSLANVALAVWKPRLAARVRPIAKPKADEVRPP